MTKTISVNEVSIQTIIALARNGDEIVLEENGEPIEKPDAKQRVLGLREGQVWTSDDFDDELPDSFWLGEEFGSIKTAKETLTLILDAPKVLEKAEFQLKIASLTKTLTELETQARDFEKVIQEKDTEIEKLRSLLNVKQSPQTDELQEECISILKILSENFEYPIAQHIASVLEISTQKAQYFLDILKSHKLLTESFNYRIGKFYKLNENGRKFLVEKNLL